MIRAIKRDNRGGTKTPYKADIHARFIEWQVMTKEEKRTEGLVHGKDFAKKYGIRPTTLSDWKRRQDFAGDKREAFILKFGDNTVDVMNGLMNRCMKYGMAYDVELWLLYVEGWDRKHVIEILKVIKLGEEDIRSLVEYLPDEKKKLFYDTLIDLIGEAERTKAIARN